MKKQLNNELIREAMKDTGTYLYEVARLAGVSEPTMVRWLRDELPKEKQIEIANKIYSSSTESVEEGS